MQTDNRRYRRTAIAGALLLILPIGLLQAEGDGEATRAEKEQQLLEILRSDAQLADKAVTCKQLAIYGSSAAVGDLAKLLSDERLSSWARIALEAIPAPEADDALRAAAAELDGRLLVGMINSIGVRKDAKSVDLLTKHIADDDGQVASAAAVALGRIGNAPATAALKAALASTKGKVRSAVAEGYVLCAEHRLAGGDRPAAIAIYDEIRAAEVPQQRLLEATRGAILARQDDGIPLLLEQLHSKDRARFRLFLTTVREFPGNQLDVALAEELSRVDGGRAPLLIQAMADRKGAVVLPAVLAASRSERKPVRLAAISALQTLGNASCLDALLDAATSRDGDVIDAAMTTLEALSDDEVDEEVVSRLRKADGSLKAALLTVVGRRQIAAINDVLPAVDDKNESVRHAALVALGETAPFSQLPVLISQAVDPRREQDGPVARIALKAASVRMPDREACAKVLAAAMTKTATPETKSALLDILAAVGGTNALKAVAAAANGDSTDLQDVSTRLLGQWMTADAAPVLLELAKADGKYQVRALRGYIRIARQFVLPPQRRAEMCERALDVAKRDAEKKLVINVLQRYPSPHTLTVAAKAAKDEKLETEATRAIASIVAKIGLSPAEVQRVLSGTSLKSVKLEIVKAEYGAGETQKDVTAIVRKHAANLPLITLASNSYNSSLGGDPAPGIPKQLKIRYRMDGKLAEASFAENALILLPVPK